MSKHAQKIWDNLTEQDFSRTYSVDNNEPCTLGEILEVNMEDFIQNISIVKKIINLKIGESFQDGIHASEVKRLS